MFHPSNLMSQKMSKIVEVIQELSSLLCMEGCSGKYTIKVDEQTFEKIAFLTNRGVKYVQNYEDGLVKGRLVTLTINCSGSSVTIIDSDNF